MSKNRDSQLFAGFGAVAEAVRATTKRLEKAALLGEYFKTLSDTDLVHAARYFAGSIFPQRDQRTANIGGAALFAALHTVTEVEEATLAERGVQLGDMGDVAGEVFATSPRTARNEAALTLDDIAAAFDKLAAIRGSKLKQDAVVTLLQNANALEAKYFIKLLSSDLRIGLREGAVEDAIARLAGAEVGKIQWANMLTGDIGETALLARHGKLDSVQMRLFHPLKFMLATPATDLADIARQMPESFYIEDKFDGIRAQVHISCKQEEAVEPQSDVGAAAPLDLHGVLSGGCRVALFSRTLDEITQAFPDLVAPLAALMNGATGDGLILDGEIVPVNGESILPFQDLQKRLGRKTPSAEILEQIPVAFVAYDILYADSRVILEEPFTTRRALLEALPMAPAQSAGTVRRADSKLFTDAALLDDEFDAARERGNEGLMVKAPASAYKPGRRGRDWLKLKRALATLDVVVTAVEVGSGGRSKFLSDYTFAVRASSEDPTLLNVGKAYSGLTNAELEEMSAWFKAHTVQQFAHGNVRVVEPEIVIEVAFDRVQASPRHKSGYALRFPRIVRLRPDKPVAEIDTLEVVKRLAGEG